MGPKVASTPSHPFAITSFQAASRSLEDSLISFRPKSGACSNDSKVVSDSVKIVGADYVEVNHGS